MNVSIISGAMGTMWVIVCSPQPIFNVFLVNHLGASSATLGLLIGLMQLSGVFQLLSIVIYAWLPSRKAFWLACHLLHRAAGLVVMGVAFFAAGGGDKAVAVRWTVAAVALSWAVMNLSSSGWWSWMADLIPERKRGTFFLKRSAVAQFVTVLWFFLSTLLLDIFPPERSFLVYGILIGVGAIAGIGDILLHFAIPEPAVRIVKAVPGPAGASSSADIDFLAPLKNRNFVIYSVSVGAVLFAMNLAIPFQAPYVTSPQGIGAPNIWLGIMTVISQLVWVAVAPFWGIVMDRYGRKPVVLLGCLVSLGWIGYFFMTAGNYIFILPVVALIAGFFGPAFWEGSGQLMLTLAPSSNRVAYIAWYNTILGLVSALASVIGGMAEDALSGFELKAGGMRFGSFHVVQLSALVAMAVAASLLYRTREGSRKTLGLVASQLAEGTLVRSFFSLDALNRPQEAGRVASALRRIEDESGALLLEEVIERLDDPSPEVREEAARALGRIGSREAVEILMAKLADPGCTIRIEAARALGRIGDRRAVPAIAAAMSDSSPELRDACAGALGTIGGDTAIESLLEAFRSGGEHSVMVMGAEAASRFSKGEYGSEAQFEIFRAATEMFPRFLSTPNSVLRKQYATAIANMLGSPGEFYQYITGGESERSNRCAALKNRFDARMRKLLAEGKVPSGESGRRNAAVEAALALLSEAMDSDRWEDALRSFFAVNDAAMRELFGADAEDEDHCGRILRIDIRMGTWCWLAEEAKRLESGFDDDTRCIFLFLGLYFLQRI